MNERKMKTIFSQKLAGYLMLRGFVLVGMEQGKNLSGKNVFYFNDSDVTTEDTTENDPSTGAITGENANNGE